MNNRRNIALVFLLVPVIVLCARGAASDAPSFTLDQVLSAPFPTELVAAPLGDRFAWEFNAKGKRSVWIAEPSGSGRYSSRAIANYPQDDGQDVGELVWTADGNYVVYVRGGDFDYPKNDYPNPTATPEGVEQDVWAGPVNGGEPIRIGEGHSPAVAPKDDRVAYVLKGEIWLAQIGGSRNPAQVIHEKGQASALRWSPDAQSLAFVTARGDHAFVGVYSFATKSITYLDPSTDSDMQPAWSPDSSKVAFIRIANENGGPYASFGERTGPPWSIRIADVATGNGREIWRAENGAGSVFRGVNAHNQLFWADGDRIVFPWERDGWTHLYSVSASGGAATLLTPGDFEVECVVLSLDRKTIVYSSNQGDIDRRHVWKVSVSGGGASVALTSGNGIETDPAIASDGHTIGILHSDAQTPMRPALTGESGAITDAAADQIPKDFPSSQLVAPQQVIFSAADGMQIHGQLFLPRNAGDGNRHAAIVFVHGGSRREMLLGFHSMRYYSNAYGVNEFLAAQGYVVLSVNYRSGIGYGLNFREALNYGPRGASEFNDVLGAATYLRSRPDVDPKRIGIWGGSYGGYLTALALARASDMFAAGVDFHGVHDWNVEDSVTIPAYDSTASAGAARVAWQSSPMSSISTWRSPVLLVQGDDDRNVQFAQMGELANALRKQGVEYEELVFPDEIHDFLLYKNSLAAYSATADFFRRHLGQ